LTGGTKTLSQATRKKNQLGVTTKRGWGCPRVDGERVLTEEKKWGVGAQGGGHANPDLQGSTANYNRQAGKWSGYNGKRF